MITAFSTRLFLSAREYYQGQTAPLKSSNFADLTFLIHRASSQGKTRGIAGEAI
jgi:hypothetical protein